MNIVYVSSVRMPNEKASGLAIAKQCEAFAALGHSMTLLYPFRRNPIQEDIFDYYKISRCFNVHQLKTVDLINHFGKFGFLLNRVFQMIASYIYMSIHAQEFEIIYARDEWMLLLPLLLGSKKQIVWEAHTKHDNFCTHFVVSRASVVITISSGLKNLYAQMAKREDIVVEASGVDVGQFSNLPAVGEVRKTLNLPDKVFVFGYIGKYTTMGEEKGVDEIVNAFASLYKDLPEKIHLLLCGLEESESRTVRTKCANLGLPQSAYTLRALDPKDFALYVQACDVLVMNYPATEHYMYYMSPLKLFAYMASGKPVITSDLPSIREVVDEDTVLFVEPGNEEDLHEKMRFAVENPGQIVEKGSETQKRSMRFTWIERARRIMQTLAI